MRIVERQWTFYEKSVVPKKAGPNQRTETKRAFYAGFVSLLAEMSGADSADIWIAQMEAINQELRDFGALVKEGRA